MKPIFRIFCVCFLLTTSCQKKQTDIYRMSNLVYMEPTINPGQKFKVKKFNSEFENSFLERFSLVTIEGQGLPSGVHVLRVVGLPDEVLSFREEGLFVNESLVSVPAELRHLSDEYLRFYYEKGESVFKVSQDGFFLIGDNMEKALDSRFLGSIHRDNIHGHVIDVY